MVEKTHPVVWAKRVEPDLIRRLYRSDAQNLQDNELVDEVGFALYARADSFIKVNRAHCEGIVECPACKRDVKVADQRFACECGWQMPRKEYHATYKSKQLVGWAVVPFAVKFMDDWKQAKDYAAKMRAIDYLIHTFHHELTEESMRTRPAAINFIGGKIEPIVKLILELAYGNGRHANNEQMERWLKNAEKSCVKNMVLNKRDEFEKQTRN